MSTTKLMLPAVFAASIAGPIAALAAETKGPQPPASTGVRVPFLHGFLSGEIAGQSKLTSLTRANEWLNSPPLTASALRGKVVLVQVWTYTCINWLRTLPYVRAWAEKYRDQGLVVIGVHAPEFSFEKNIDNVRRAAKEMKIDYPIAIDNDYAIWRAFKNQYWPALYFVDAQGRVRHHHFGEGAYQQSEMTIRALLAETGGSAGATDREPVSVDPQGVEAGADWSSLRSPENYVGYRTITRTRGRERHVLHLVNRARRRAPPCGGRARRVREAARPARRGLAQLVRGVHGPGAGRQTAAVMNSLPA
jgi:thiol-disulfide isomerase/thioredoxin